jgi:hypothetical protein
MDVPGLFTKHWYIMIEDLILADRQALIMTSRKGVR